jgi:hypothetical protein
MELNKKLEKIGGGTASFKNAFELISKKSGIDIDILIDVISVTKKQIGDGVKIRPKTDLEAIKKKLGNLPTGYENMIANNDPSVCNLSSIEIKSLPDISKQIGKKENLMPYHIFPKKGYSKYTKKNPNTKGKGRKWTHMEELWIWWLKYEEKLTINMVAYCMKRKEKAITNKLRRLRKKYGYYNSGHRIAKYDLNRLIVEKVKPKTVLEPYSGPCSFFKTLMKEGGTSIESVITNDIDPHFDTDYTMDASAFVSKFFSSKKKFDLIDIDPYGDGFSCIEPAIRMVKKGLIITLGELGHKVHNRLDTVSRSYFIDDTKDYNAEFMIKRIQKMGERHNKKLIRIDTLDKDNIARVYFRVEKLTENKFGGKKKK